MYILISEVPKKKSRKIQEVKIKDNKKKTNCRVKPKTYCMIFSYINHNHQKNPI